MMDEKKIIKDNVSPILSPVEKRRYTQASKFFTRGMNTYVQDYIIGVKQLVDTKQIQTVYTKQYTDSFQEYKARFDELKKKTTNASKSITKKLGVFILGAGAFYLLMKGAAKIFQQSFKSFGTFVSDIYDLGKATAGDVIGFTQYWSMRVLNYFPNLKKTIENIIKDVPHLLDGMFNFICNGFHYIFNQSQIFQNILINTALTAYNASFSTSWGWVLGLVLKRARLRQMNALSSTSYAKFGVDVQQQIQDLNIFIEKYIVGDESWRHYRQGVSYKFSNAKNWGWKQGQLGEYVQMDYPIVGNKKLSNEIRSNSDSEQFVKGMTEMFKDTRRYMQSTATSTSVGIYSSMNFLDTSEITSDEIVTIMAHVGVKSNGGNLVNRESRRIDRVEKNIAEMYVHINGSEEGNIFQKILTHQKKYEHLYNQNPQVKKIIDYWRGIGDIHNRMVHHNPTWTYAITSVNVVKLIRILYAWIMFDYVQRKTNYIVQGIRYHSRFATSYADVIKNQYMSIISIDIGSTTTTSFERQYKQYVNYQSDLNQYVDVAVDWMKKTKEEKLKTDEKIQQVGANIMIKWRDLLGIGILQKKMRNIQNLFRIAYQQKMYGVSYASGQIYNFSDDVSDASLSKTVVQENNKVKELYAGSFEKLKDIKSKKDKDIHDNGMDVGQYSSTGVVRNSVAKLDDKSSLAYIAYQIALMYYQVKNHINQLRVQRSQLINSIHKSLNGLKGYKNKYNKIIYIDAKGSQ